MFCPEFPVGPSWAQPPGPCHPSCSPGGGHEPPSGWATPVDCSLFSARPTPTSPPASPHPGFQPDRSLLCPLPTPAPSSFQKSPPHCMASAYRAESNAAPPRQQPCLHPTPSRSPTGLADAFPPACGSSLVCSGDRELLVEEKPQGGSLSVCGASSRGGKEVWGATGTSALGSGHREAWCGQTAHWSPNPQPLRGPCA